MKLPEKPPNWKKIIKEKREKVLRTLTEQKLFSVVLDYNKRYLYWSELKYRIKNKEQRAALWAAMKLMRDGKENICSCGKINVKYNSLSEINKSLHYFDKQLAGNIVSQTESLGLEEKYIISSLMEEAIASSMIEGAATTRKAAKKMLQEERRPANRAERMVLNNFTAMEFISRNKSRKLTPTLILETQGIVTKGTLDEKKDEGMFRDNNDVVVRDGIDSDQVAHVPPDYRQVPGLIRKLCDFANTEDEDFIHPVIKGIIIHFLIGYIHPFNEGNGRTARSIFYWYMLSRGYWLFEYLAVSRRIIRSRKEYDLAYLYSEYDEMDLTYFVKYNISCIKDALEDLFAYIKEKQKEQREIRKIIDEKYGLNVRQIDIVSKFRQEPDKPFTIKEIKNTYDVSYATARADLFLLTEKGIISKRTAGKEFIFLLNKDT